MYRFRSFLIKCEVLFNRMKFQLVYRCIFGYRFGKKTFILSPLLLLLDKYRIGENVYIWPGARIEAVKVYYNQIFEPHLIIGDEVSVQQGLHLTHCGKLEIGARTTISSYVLITDIDHEHSDDSISVLKQRLKHRPTKIGKNCFIGAGSVILAGTVLGDHCVVGAGSVVRGEFPTGSTIVGSPGRVIKSV